MSNNLKCIVNRIFDRIKSGVDESQESRINEQTQKIKPDENLDETCKFVIHSKLFVKRYNIANILLVEYEEEKYVLLGLEYEETLIRLGYSQESEDYILQAMGFLAISNDVLDFKPETTSSMLLDNCLCLEADKGNFVEIDWSTIKDFFEEYVVFKCNDYAHEVIYCEDVDRLYAFMLLPKSEIYSSCFIDFQKLILLKSTNCIIDNVISALENNVKKYNYLQLYQCIEYLYVIYIALELIEKHDIERCTAVQISLENYMRASESILLEKLIKKFVSESILINLTEAHLDVQSLTIETAANKAATKIYKIRCNIAHLKYNQGNFLNTIKWESEFEFVMRILVNIYEQINLALVEIAVDNKVWNSMDFYYINNS